MQFPLNVICVTFMYVLLGGGTEIYRCKQLWPKKCKRGCFRGSKLTILKKKGIIIRVLSNLRVNFCVQILVKKLDEEKTTKILFFFLGGCILAHGEIIVVCLFVSSLFIQENSFNTNVLVSQEALTYFVHCMFYNMLKQFIL